MEISVPYAGNRQVRHRGILYPFLKGEYDEEVKKGCKTQNATYRYLWCSIKKRLKKELCCVPDFPTSFNLLFDFCL